MHEASTHDANAFITLTYDKAHLPEHGSLRKQDFQNFMKRLRRRLDPIKIRFFHSGEYGEEYGRPHYHAIIFGYNFPDRVPAGTRGEHRIYRSQLLEEVWTNGFSEIGELTYQSASYVAKYCVKKLTGEEAAQQYRRIDPKTNSLVPIEPEYATMSRRPGIGAEFYRRFGEEVHRFDSIIINGKEVKPPKYYDKLAEETRPETLERNKKRRQRGVDPENQWPDRLTTREKVAIAKHKLFKGH